MISVHQPGLVSLKKQAVLMMGLPGAGKSTVIKEHYKEWNIISADEIKTHHPAYDPSHPEKVHEWSVQQAKMFMVEAANSGVDKLCLDGGGVNSNYSLSIIRELLKRNYHVILHYVKTPLDVCLERVRKRDRPVPNDVICEKAQKIERCFWEQSQLAHEVIVDSYYTDKYIFTDMDGVIAAYQNIPFENVNFFREKVFERARPVYPVIDILEKLHLQGKEIFVFSACPNSVAAAEKKRWIETHVPFIKKVYFVGNKQYKMLSLSHLLESLKIHPKDCTYIDDEHDILRQANAVGINCLHVSEFLSYESNNRNGLLQDPPQVYDATGSISIAFQPDSEDL